MITQIFLSSFTTSEEDFSNGANMEINYCDGDEEVEIKIVGDGGEQIIKPFRLSKEEIIRGINKLC